MHSLTAINTIVNQSESHVLAECWTILLSKLNKAYGKDVIESSEIIGNKLKITFKHELRILTAIPEAHKEYLHGNGVLLILDKEIEFDISSLSLEIKGVSNFANPANRLFPMSTVYLLQMTHSKRYIDFTIKYPSPIGIENEFVEADTIKSSWENAVVIKNPKINKRNLLTGDLTKLLA